MLTSFGIGKNFSSWILNKLKWFDGLCRKAFEKTIAIIKPAGDKSMNEFSKSCFDIRCFCLAMFVRW